MAFLSNSSLKEAIKFALVGVSGVGINFLMIFLVTLLTGDILSFADELAIFMGIATSITTNYLLNRAWTFRSDNPILGEYLRYVLSNGFGALLQFIVAVILENIFEATEWVGLSIIGITIPSIYFASGTGILVGFISNFLFSKFFVFVEQDDTTDQSVS